MGDQNYAKSYEKHRQASFQRFSRFIKISERKNQIFYSHDLTNKLKSTTEYQREEYSSKTRQDELNERI